MNIDGSILSLILGIVGGILGVISIAISFVIGAFSIWATWKLYQAGNNAQLKLIELVAKIDSTTRRAEFIQRDVNQTTLKALVEQLRSVSSSVTAAHHRAAEKIKSILTELPEQSTVEQIGKAKEKILGELASSFGEVKEETARVSTITEIPVAPVMRDQEQIQHQGRPIPAALHTLVKWMDKIKKKDSKAYFTPRHVHQDVFHYDPEIGKAIEIGISIKVLGAGEREHPFDPGKKIGEIMLNYEHPVTKSILGNGS